jgi:hypothetical protein
MLNFLRGKKRAPQNTVQGMSEQHGPQKLGGNKLTPTEGFPRDAPRKVSYARRRLPDEGTGSYALNSFQLQRTNPLGTGVERALTNGPIPYWQKPIYMPYSVGSTIGIPTQYQNAAQNRMLDPQTGLPVVDNSTPEFSTPYGGPNYIAQFSGTSRANDPFPQYYQGAL